MGKYHRWKKKGAEMTNHGITVQRNDRLSIGEICRSVSVYVVSQPSFNALNRI
jgi:hypothetical protein